MQYDLTFSIVTYNNDRTVLEKAIKSLLSTNLKSRLILVDNSESDSIRGLCDDARIEYIFNNDNVGFGAGHNIAIRKCLENSKFHLIINPDIYFTEGTLEKICLFMERQPEIGVVMPKILYPDGAIQYLCKQLPTPFDLIIRRFIPGPLKFIFKKRFVKYELRDKNYGEVMDVPCLSGCFMFVRTEIFSHIGLFDERYFMYLEDVDLCKRIGAKFRTVYYPEASVYHHYDKGSYKSCKLLYYHVMSAIRYFNKWGWLPLV